MEINETITLDFGDNELQIKAVNSAGETTETRMVEQTLEGEFYALLIAVEDYQYIKRLDRPIDDARELERVLTTQYTFKPENVKVLENKTRSEILGELYRLRSQLIAQDNLLVFYAGHGLWDVTDEEKNRGIGYWQPKDAELNNPANWISNSDIRDNIKAIKSKNTLLISDACFSGSILRTARAGKAESAQKMYNTTSRRAMTSGSLKTVPDKSVFLEYLIKRLDENTEKYLPAGNLFYSFEQAVRNNSENIPRYGVIQGADDEGGDFIFIKK